MRLWRRWWPARGPLVETTVPANKVQPGDLIIPKDADKPIPDGRRPVIEIRKYSSPNGLVTSVYLIVVSGGYVHNSIYLPDEPVSVVRTRRVRFRMFQGQGKP